MTKVIRLTGFPTGSTHLGNINDHAYISTEQPPSGIQNRVEVREESGLEMNGTESITAATTVGGRLKWSPWIT
jgi:hypothetical protein